MDTKMKRSSNKITADMVTRSFDIGKKITNKEMSLGDGVQALVSMGMNKNSATDYIYFYKKLLSGEKFIRQTNMFATNYFLDRILLENGKGGLRTALNSLSAHLDYYEEKAKVSVKQKRDIVEKFSKKL